MNNVLTNYINDPNIQLPFTAPILNFLQFANKEMVFALAESLAGFDVIQLGTPIALFDMVNYGSGIDDGYVLRGNEVFYFQGFSGAFTGSTQVFQEDFQYNSVDTYTDGVARQTRQLRYLKLVDSNTPSTGGTQFYLSGMTYLTIPKTQMSLLNSFTSTAYARKDLGRRVSFDGIIGHSTAPGTLIMFNLPAGMRPSTAKQIPIAVQYASGGLMLDTLSIATNGNVSLAAINVGTGGTTIYLDGVSFNII